MAKQRHADERTNEPGASMGLMRRGILAAAGAAVAGIVAKQASQPVAANGDTWTIPYSATITSSTPGLYINNTAGAAISGESSTFGVFGNGNAGVGVFGGSGTFSTFGFAKIGVVGINKADNATGVWGIAGTGVGVLGTSESSIGVVGRGGPRYPGVQGMGGNGGNGIEGYATGTGTGGVNAGLYGLSTSTYGIIGTTTAPGYSGLTAITGTPGVAALAATATVNTAYAAYFQGTTVVQGDFAVVGGNKSAAVKDASGQHRLVYCVESPESWFEDFGTGTLINGRAEVKHDPIFTQIAHTDEYHVFLTPRGDCKGLYVGNQSAAGFSVQELQGGASTLGFSYRVVAKRADIKGERLAKFDLLKIKVPDESKLIKPEAPKAAPLPLPPRKP